MGVARILVVDDDPVAASYMKLALTQDSHSVEVALGGVEALGSMEREIPHLLVTDLRMPDMDGLKLLSRTKERWPELPVILVTVEADVATVVEAVQRGAANYLVKPVSPATLRTAAAKALAAAFSKSSPADRCIPEIVGKSPAMVLVKQLVTLAARSDVNVLVTGETGTGKDLVVRVIHRLSSLSRGPLLAQNCALIPPELFETQFFGHRRGAFTGAQWDHKGLLEEARGGVLFLDELECLSLSHQAKLLRVLDDGEVRPVGASSPRTVHVRYMAATNRDPAAMLAAGTLREDLYYRLRGFEIQLPSLRERREDIPLLAEHFLQRHQGPGITAEALGDLQGVPWPGNVRQLQNVLATARALTGGGKIQRRHLALDQARDDSPAPFVSSSKMGDATKRPANQSTGRTLKDIERQAILEALHKYQGRRVRAAQALGIDRSTLRRKMRELGIRLSA